MEKKQQQKTSSEEQYVFFQTEFEDFLLLNSQSWKVKAF